MLVVSKSVSLHRASETAIQHSTIEDAQKALRGALQDIEDPEVKYKIRTALQFCEVVKYQEDKLLSIIEEDTTTDNSEVFDRLRELGYLE